MVTHSPSPLLKVFRPLKPKCSYLQCQRCAESLVTALKHADSVGIQRVLNMYIRFEDMFTSMIKPLSG